jgi:hypothetical protein
MPALLLKLCEINFANILKKMKEIESLAITVKKELKLNYDADSVKFIEGFIERNKSAIPKDQWNGLINSCGAFLGQCIIENYGGHWEKDNDGLVCISFDDKNKAYPFAKVNKQFENGIEDSIYSFYIVIPKVFKLESTSMKKKWWQF